MEVKAAAAVVTRKLADMLNEESVVSNKVMMHQLKGVQKSLVKLRDFSPAAEGGSDVSEREREHLRVLYEVEDEIEKFTFRVARQRKKFGFLMKPALFFSNLNSCRKLNGKIKRIRSGTETDGAMPGSTVSSSLHSSVNEGEDDDDEDDNDDGEEERDDLARKSSSAVWPIQETPSTPSPRHGVLSRLLSEAPLAPEHVSRRKKLTFGYSYNEDEMNFVGFKEERLQYPKQMSNFSYQEEEPGIFGFDDDIKSLVKRLTHAATQKEKVVPIVGEEGSGKTTLARAVYRNRNIKAHFELHSWVSVSKEYNAKHILLGLLKKVATFKDKGATQREQQALKTRLFDHLKGARYLIVLDGVGSCGVLEDLNDAFPGENNGSKIIFTSCKVWRSQKMKLVPHNMNRLQEADSWDMFLKKCGKEHAGDHVQWRPKQRILDICKGLPLNIVLIAGLLSTKRTTEWSSVMGPGRRSEEVVSMCYDDLTVHSKLRLLYLTFFPKDYDIPVRRLLRLWLAEGFVKRRSQRIPPEDLVQKHFEDLVDRNMIQITKLRSDNSPRRCRLVSAVHDYLLPKAQDISLFHINRKLEYCEDAASPFGVRRMVQYKGTPGARSKKESAAPSSSVSSLSRFFSKRRENMHVENSNSVPSEGSTFDPSLVRSYVSFNFQRKDTPGKEVGTLLHRMIESGFGLLRVLDLEGVCKPSLSDKLGQLCNLRYLGLRWTFLESLPESVGDLPFLETLDVKHTSIDSLPDSIWKLKQLRHLNLNKIRLDTPPSSSSTLLTLWGLFVDEKISVNEVFGKLLGLRELGITFHLSTSQGVLIDWIAKLMHLQSLRLHSVDGMGRPSKLVLKSLSDLGKLSHLNLLGHLERLPTKDEFPPTVKVLTLSISKLEEDPMETLEQLPSLIVLQLLADSYAGRKMVCRGGGFKKLRVLKLWMLRELEEWDVEEDAMESLKELDIRCCRKLSNVPCRLLQKQRCLEELILTDMPDGFKARAKERKLKDTSLTINPWEFAPREAESRAT